MAHFIPKNVTDSEDEICDKPTIDDTGEDGSKPGVPPSDTTSSDDDDELDRGLCSAPNNRYEYSTVTGLDAKNISFSASAEPADTSSHDGHGQGATKRFPFGEVAKYVPDQWHYEKNFKLFCRNQTRKQHTKHNVTEEDIQLNELLKHYPGRNENGVHLFFRATSTDSAISTIESGAEIKRKASDLARKGGYYLNVNYQHCYQWLWKKNHKFQGDHAMLIYLFDPWNLSIDGEELDQGTWKNICLKINEGKHNGDWFLAPMNRDPANFEKDGKNPQPVYLDDGKTLAQQLVIRSQPMCDKMNAYLIGCIFYEKLNNSRKKTKRKIQKDHQEGKRHRQPTPRTGRRGIHHKSKAEHKNKNRRNQTNQELFLIDE